MPEIFFDHEKISINGRSFVPMISDIESEKNNVVSVYLDGSPQSYLKWDSSLDKAYASENRILWHLDLGLEKGMIQNITDNAARMRACETLTEKVTAELLDNSFAIMPFCGHLHNLLLPGEEPIFKATEQALDRLVQYLAELSFSLPDLPIMVAIDVTGINPIELIVHFHRERFSHLLLAIKGMPFTYPNLIWKEGKGVLGSFNSSKPLQIKSEIAVLLPNENIKSFPNLENYLLHSISKQENIRLLYEDFATDEWEELDTLIVFEPLSEKQQRIAKGFEAAGGKLKYQS
jgi:hypothetical protein